MAFALGQHKVAAPAVNVAISTAYASNVTAGNLLTCIGIEYASGMGSPTCTNTGTAGAQTWKSLVSFSSVTASTTINIYYAIASGTGSCTVTVNYADITHAGEIYLAEWSGASISALLVQDGAGQTHDGTAATIILPSITTTSPDDLVFGYCSCANAGTVVAPWNLQDGTAGDVSFYQADLAAGTYTPDVTQSSGVYACAMVAVGIPSATAPAPPAFLTSRLGPTAVGPEFFTSQPQPQFALQTSVASVVSAIVLGRAPSGNEAVNSGLVAPVEVLSPTLGPATVGRAYTALDPPTIVVPSVTGTSVSLTSVAATALGQGPTGLESVLAPYTAAGKPAPAVLGVGSAPVETIVSLPTPIFVPTTQVTSATSAAATALGQSQTGLESVLAPYVLPGTPVPRTVGPQAGVSFEAPLPQPIVVASPAVAAQTADALASALLSPTLGVSATLSQAADALASAPRGLESVSSPYVEPGTPVPITVGPQSGVSFIAVQPTAIIVPSIAGVSASITAVTAAALGQSQTGFESVLTPSVVPGAPIPDVLGVGAAQVETIVSLPIPILVPSPSTTVGPANTLASGLFAPTLGLTGTLSQAADALAQSPRGQESVLSPYVSPGQPLPRVLGADAGPAFTATQPQPIIVATAAVQAATANALANATLSPSAVAALIVNSTGANALAQGQAQAIFDTPYVSAGSPTPRTVGPQVGVSFEATLPQPIVVGMPATSSRGANALANALLASTTSAGQSVLPSQAADALANETLVATTTAGQSVSPGQAADVLAQAGASVLVVQAGGTVSPSGPIPITVGPQAGVGFTSVQPKPIVVGQPSVTTLTAIALGKASATAAIVANPVVTPQGGYVAGDTDDIRRQIKLIQHRQVAKEEDDVLTLLLMNV